MFFCKPCTSDYKINKFTNFQNTCIHEEAQCETAFLSVTFITPLELVTKYTEHLVILLGVFNSKLTVIKKVQTLLGLN